MYSYTTVNFTSGNGTVDFSSFTAVVYDDGFIGDGSGDNALNPLIKPVSGELNAENWNALLEEIKTDNKFIALDLSGCTIGTHSSGGGLYTDGTFDPNSAVSNGKNKIVSLILPATATKIALGTYNDPTFKNFSILKTVTGSNVTQIGEWAFYNCIALTTISFPGVTEIADYAFYRCSYLMNTNLPEVTVIGNNAFSNCESLVGVNLPNAEVVGRNAFEYCTRLTSVSIPDAIDIGNGAFFNCTELSNITISKAASIGDMAFADCPKATFSVVGSGSLSVIENGKILVRNNTELVAYPSAAGSITMTAITIIGNGVFSNNRSITSVSFPNVLTVGSGVFSNCSSTISVSFPRATSIGRQAFIYSSISSITIGANCVIDTDGNDFAGYYNSNGMQAGTYTKNGNIWNYSS
jgi:hypothetical protein